MKSETKTAIWGIVATGMLFTTPAMANEWWNQNEAGHDCVASTDEKDAPAYLYNLAKLLYAKGGTTRPPRIEDKGNEVDVVSDNYLGRRERVPFFRTKKACTDFWNEQEKVKKEHEQQLEKYK
jgi:hypothetical protein